MGKLRGSARHAETVNFERFVAFVRDEIGVTLNGSKRLMLEGRLRQRCLTLGISSFDDYLEALFEQGALEEERTEIFDAVTTNKTDFFREAEHFRILAQRCLPEFRASGRPMMKVWSAAASIGVEAYTIGMVLSEEARKARFEWAVLGTDVNTRVLAAAQRAIYSVELGHTIPAPLRDRYLLFGHGNHADTVRIHPDLRRRTRFQRLNLMDEIYPIDQEVDVIFLRNVLIYFSSEDQARVIHRLSTHLVPGGTFFVGHSESMTVRHRDLEQIAPATYRKV